MNGFIIMSDAQSSLLRTTFFTSPVVGSVSDSQPASVAGGLSTTSGPPALLSGSVPTNVPVEGTAGTSSTRDAEQSVPPTQGEDAHASSGCVGGTDGSSHDHTTEEVRECKIVVLNLNGREVCSFSRWVRMEEAGPSSVRREKAQCSGHDAAEDGSGPDKTYPGDGCGGGTGVGGCVVGSAPSGGNRPGGGVTNDVHGERRESMGPVLDGTVTGPLREVYFLRQ